MDKAQDILHYKKIEMKTALVSTRGIPNNYGGFDQFAEYISVGLAKRRA